MSIEQLGPYRIEKVLGRGGMGTVFAAVDQQTGQRVAVKQLAAGMSDDEHFRWRFASEIEALIKLKHANIVDIIGHGEQDGQLFFAMELVDGSSLFDELKKGRRFDWREVTRIGIDVCAALRHAHDRGVIHRDLKPGNLLIDAAGSVKLTDFGIAKLFGGSQLTADGGIIGTAEYMAPEQAQGQPITPRSDLYSLGSVLFALLTRRPPFAGRTLPEVVKSVSFEVAPPVSRFVDDVPRELEEIIARLLEKDPSKRIPTAQSVSIRLSTLLAEDAATANKVTPSSDDEFVLCDPERTVAPGVPDSSRPTAVVPADRQEDKSQPRPANLKTEVPNTLALTEAPADSATPIPRVAPPPATHFTTVDEGRRRQAEVPTAEEPHHGPLWPFAIVLAAVVVLAAAGVAYTLWPPSAEKLYGQITAVAEQGDIEDLAKVEDQCRAFVEQFPDDDRSEQVEQYLLQIEASRFPRRIRQKVRLRGFDALSPIEQIYLQALEKTQSDPAAATATLQALVDAYGPLAGDARSNEQCLAAARTQIELLKQEAKQSETSHLADLEKSLRRAEQLRASDPQSAAVIYRGIVQLYAEKTWARQPVERARAALDELAKTPAATP